MNEFERTIAELETLFTDSEFKEAVDEVRLINELLADEPTSESDAIAMVKDLNKKWRALGYYGKEMFVTGGVHIGGEYGNIEYSEFDADSVAPLKSWPFISNGFSMFTSVTDTDGDPLIRQHIVMTGRIEYDDDSEFSVEGKTNEACGIELTPDTYVEFRELTAPKALAWLEMYYPDTKLLIDECVIQANDESEATINLRDTPLPTVENRKKEAQRQKRAIQVYIDSLVKYEMYVPYLMELFGECELFDAHRAKWEDKEIMSNEKSMIIVQTVTVEIEKKTKEIKLFMQGLLVSSDKAEAKLIRMPLQTIVTMESGRELLRTPKK